MAYGVAATPSSAPTANTAPWASTRATPTGPGTSSSATARTTVVRTAAKRGPRGSTPTTGRARSGGVAGGSGRVRDALTGGLLGRSYGYAARPRVRGDDAGTESRESADRKN